MDPSNNASDTTLNSLHDELLSGIFKLVGIHAISSLASCNKLHGLWQRTVQSLDTMEQPLTAKDVRTIRKFKNLRHIRLYSTTADAVPISKAVRCIVPALAMLKSMHVSGAGAFGALHGIASIRKHCQQLQELQIRDVTHDLSEKDTYALACLKDVASLASLSLACNKLEAGWSYLHVWASRLTSLQSLSLTTLEPVDEDQMAAFPGGLTTLQALTLITPQDSLRWAFAGTKQLHAAVQGLRNLRSLSTNFFNTEVEPEANLFSSLSKLTSLGLGIDVESGPEYTWWFPLQEMKVPQDLQELQEISAPWHRLHADGLFAHSSLETVSVGGLQLTDTWRDRTAEGSRIWRLQVTDSIADADWFRLPTLPELQELEASYAASATGRHRGLADALSRHASTLEVITLSTKEHGFVFEETLPEEMPECRSLSMTGVSPGTLRALSHCCWPRLRDVTLRSWHNAPAVEGADFTWLYNSWQTIWYVEIHVTSADVAAAVESALDDLFARVQVSWEGMPDAEDEDEDEA